MHFNIDHRDIQISLLKTNDNVKVFLKRRNK